ncbi:MAG TPA: NTP transferase domain-containing protein [Bacteroidales bacterium]|nr:NTP transferase domain-containing protein [Bacteroidales bacterium]
MNYSSIILAAGTSGRMGIPKISLEFDENHNFAEQLCERFNTPECKKIILVVNNNGAELVKTKNFVLSDKTEIVINNHTERGRFYSLKCGLSKCDNLSPVFFTNIDNPFVKADIIYNLINELQDADYVCPVFKAKGGHPVLISPKIISKIFIEKDDSINLKIFLKNYKRKNVEVDDNRILANINTREEYDKWFPKT